MRKYRYLFIAFLILELGQGCSKNDAVNDLTQLTIGTKNLGTFIPKTEISYKRPKVI